MNFARLFSLILLLLVGACTVGGKQNEPSTLQSHTDSQLANPVQNSPKNTPKTSDSDSKDPCLNIRRPLNPESNPNSSETDLDRYFRLAYNAETEGNFDASIDYYRKAVELATCDCDLAHAKAGEQAATEASKLTASSRPTQFFWGRLQQLTKSLSCVTTR